MRSALRRSASTGPEPVGYAKADRQDDVRHGRRDGHQRLPSYTHLSALIENQRWFTTPYSEELWDIGRDRMQSELVAYRRAVMPKHQLLAALRENLVAATEEVARGELALQEANAQLTPDEIRPRNPQEAARSGEELRNRRMVMRAKRIRDEQERQDRRVAAVAALRQRVSQTCGEMDQDFALAQDRARVLAEHTARRVATYWGAVTASHSEGRQMALLLPYIRGVLPTWLSATSREGVLEPPLEDDPPSRDTSAS